MIGTVLNMAWTLNIPRLIKAHRFTDFHVKTVSRVSVGYCVFQSPSDAQWQRAQDHTYWNADCLAHHDEVKCWRDHTVGVRSCPRQVWEVPPGGEVLGFKPRKEVRKVQRQKLHYEGLLAWRTQTEGKCNMAAVWFDHTVPYVTLYKYYCWFWWHLMPEVDKFLAQESGQDPRPPCLQCWNRSALTLSTGCLRLFRYLSFVLSFILFVSFFDTFFERWHSESFHASTTGWWRLCSWVVHSCVHLSIHLRFTLFTTMHLICISSPVLLIFRTEYTKHRQCRCLLPVLLTETLCC